MLSIQSTTCVVIIAHNFGNILTGAHPEDGVSDLTLISNIDERGINLTLSTRYKRDEIYVTDQPHMFTCLLELN